MRSKGAPYRNLAGLGPWSDSEQVLTVGQSVVTLWSQSDGRPAGVPGAWRERPTQGGRGGEVEGAPPDPEFFPSQDLLINQFRRNQFLNNHLPINQEPHNLPPHGYGVHGVD